MGMAASQARLLSITARMHDVEFQAQNIMNQKVALSTQKDEVYSDYCAALDAKKIQVAFTGESGSLNFVDATYASVCGFQENRNGNYAMVDTATGLMIVEPEVYEAYQNYSNDKYSFAWAMLGFEQNDFAWSDNGYEGTGDQIGVGVGGTGITVDEKYNVVSMSDVEDYVFNLHKEDGTLDKDVESAYNNYQEAVESSEKKDISKRLKQFRDALYKAYKSEIYDIMRLDKSQDKETSLTSGKFKEDFENDFQSHMNEFNYYVQLFEGIEENGGCMTINDFVKDGDTGNNWFNNIINSGKAIISEYRTTGTKRGWNEISVSTSTNLQEVSDDTDLKKAEAKYEYELSIINNKDKKYDQDLNKLETERTALKTELDSIKQVEKDNIERTFGIFS